MEYVSGGQSLNQNSSLFFYFLGDLMFHIMNRGKFTVEETRLYAAEIVIALMYLHR